MILQALNQLYDRLKNEDEYNIIEPGFSIQPIAFKIILNLDGSVYDIQDIRCSEANGKKATPQKLRVLGGNKPSGSGINPTLLWDTVPYLFAWTKTNPNDPEDKKLKDLEKAKKQFNGSKEFHKKYEKEIDDEGYSAVCKFYDKWNPEMLDSKYSFIKSLVGGYGVFQLLGDVDYVHNRSAVQKWYNQSRQIETKDDNAKTFSLISGDYVVPARLHEKIKGLGQQAAPFASFNKSAFCSYRKEQSINAPISEPEAFRYGAALNALTDGPMRKRHLVRLGDSTSNSGVSVVFWAEKKSPCEDIFQLFLAFDNIDKGEETASDKDIEEIPDDVRENVSIDIPSTLNIKSVYEYLRSGAIPNELPMFDSETTFYVLGLSVNVTRVVVRFFIQSTFEEILRNFKKHYDDMRLYSDNDDYINIPSVKRILDQTCPMKKNRPDREKIPANLENLLFRSIFQGISYPASVYQRLISRFKLDQSTKKGDFIKISFIKAYLTRNYGKELPMSLNPNLTEPEYLLGRLFAIFEKTQRDALGDTGTTIRSSYMSSASSHPGSVFPRLFKLYNHHLNKLTPPQKIAREKLVQDIMAKLDNSLPEALDYKAQGTFFIGFYQQMQSFFQKNESNTEASANNEEINQNNN